MNIAAHFYYYIVTNEGAMQLAQNKDEYLSPKNAVRQSPEAAILK